jgi:diamine N-acetyltransferase
MVPLTEPARFTLFRLWQVEPGSSRPGGVRVHRLDWDDGRRADAAADMSREVDQVTTVEVVQATADDAQLLSELGARTFRDTFAADNTEADMADYLATAFSRQVQADELAEAESLFLIARVDGAPAGYTRLRFGFAPDCVTESVGGTSPVELRRFYADLHWIGRGVGPALMKTALELAETRGCDVAWLDVWEKNQRAISFYSKWGFSIVGDQTFLLGEDVQHDLIMARKIS